MRSVDHIVAWLVLVWGWWPCGFVSATQGSTTPSFLQEQRACVYDNFKTVFSSCSAKASPRDELIKLLQHCTGANTTGAPQVVRISAPLSSFGLKIQALTRTYAKLLSLAIQVPFYQITQTAKAAEDSIENAPYLNRTQEAWMSVLQYHLGDAMEAGALRTITDVVTLDTRLDWFTYLPVLREAALLYKSEVIAAAGNAFTRLFMYRKDVFAKHNIPVPRTWRELLSFARQYNGTDGMHAVCLHGGSCYGGGMSALWEIMSAYFQTQGYKHPGFVDADTLEMLLDNEAAAEVLDLYKALVTMSPPDDSETRICPLYPYRFAAGQCMTTTFISFGYKLMSHRSQFNMAAVRGKVGYSLLLGTERVYDRNAKKLIPCDPLVCPYAKTYTNPDGSTILVNHVPQLHVLTYTFNKYSPPDTSFYTLSVASYLMSEAVTKQLLLDPSTEYSPTRTYQLNPALWIAAGYNEQDTYEFLASYRESMYHPNIRLETRFPGGIARAAAWAELTTPQALNMSTSQWMKVATQRFSSIINTTFGGNMTHFKMDYWASLNREWPRGQPAPTPPPSIVIPDAPTQPDDTSTRLSTIIPSVVLPVVAALLALLAARYSALFKSRRRGLSHPGPGPLTTLCVTDIESSTLLWEELDPQLMDASVKLHNVCIRKLVAKHDGYESVWEGDSFIIAFHTPSQALRFCMDVQQELLSLPWPTELLQSTYAEEVCCTVTKRKELRSKPELNKLALNTDDGWDAKDGGRSSNGEAAQLKRPEALAVPSRRISLNISQQGPACVDLLGTRASIPDECSNPDSTFESVGALISTQHSLGFLQPAYQSGGIHHAGTRGEDADTVDGCHGGSWALRGYWQSMWQRCSPGAAGAVLAYRGLRVRLGLHAGVPDAAAITFNSVMQRYHYTGPVRVFSNAVASAGHGGYTLMTTDTAALLDSDKAGLPEQCGMYYWGRHLLSGVGEPQQLLLVLPDSLKCRLALQECEPRVDATKAPGIWACPVPSPAAAHAATALVYVQFTGLQTLLAWNAEEAATAIRAVLTCIQDTMAVCRGVLSEDGLSMLLQPAACKPALPRLGSSSRVVCAFSKAASMFSYDSRHPAVAFALAVRDRLLAEQWSDRLLQHELAEPVGVTSRTGSVTQPDLPYPSLTQPDSSLGVTACKGSAAQSDADTSQDCAQIPRGTVSIDLGSQVDGWPMMASQPDPLENKTGQRTTAVASMLGSLQQRLKQSGRLPKLMIPSISMASADKGPGSPGAASPKTRPKQKTYVVLPSVGLRGPRFRIVVVDARGATHTVATRTTGLVVFSGPPEKRAGKVMGKAKPGQIAVDTTLLSV